MRPSKAERQPFRNMQRVSRCSFRDNHEPKRLCSGGVFRRPTQRPISTLGFPRLKERDIR